jgi:hypothetical protein
MNRYDGLLERLSSANPVPGPEYVDAGELNLVFSVITDRKGVVTQTKTSPKQRTFPRVNRWRPVAAFGGGLVVALAVVGVATLLMRGTPDGAPVATAAPPVTVTSPPPATTTPNPVRGAEVPPTTGVAPADVAEPYTRTISDQPEFFASLALNPDGLPVITSYTRTEGDSGTARLFACRDTACEDFEWVSTVAYCDEPTCSAGVTRTVIAEGVNHLPWHAALGAEGNLRVWLPLRRETEPALAYLGSGRTENQMIVVSCFDAACTNNVLTAGPVHATPGPNWPLQAFQTTSEPAPISVGIESVYDPDELAAFVELQRQFLERLAEDPGELAPVAANLNLAVCADPVCTTFEIVTIDSVPGTWYLDSLELAIAPDGTIYVLAGNDAHVGDPGLRLYGFPGGEIEGVTPIAGVSGL